MNAPPKVVIVGAGLAGLATAVGLAPKFAKHGGTITLLESRPRLGGRASSFTDPATGQLLDACQHVSMGCCYALTGFLKTLKLTHLLEDQPKLWFQTPDRRVSLFKADPWPAPFHLGRTLTGAHYLSPIEKLRVVFGLVQLLREPPDGDRALRPFLLANKQTERTLDRFWGVVLTSALNETLDRIGTKYARKVFRDGFIADRDGFTVQVPKVPLGRLYGDELRMWLTAHGVTVRENAAVRSVRLEGRTPVGVELRSGEFLPANQIVLAVPFDRVLDLLPESIAMESFFARIKNLNPSPITSVHVWYDKPILDKPHVVLVDCLGQWVFNRGQDASGAWYVQVVVSAARMLRGFGREKIEQEIVAELGRLFPHTANLVRAKVVTEQTATFSAVPGVDAFRPPQQTPLAGLFLAGDWTDTGWPATMEGAVISGNRAAAALANFVESKAGSSSLREYV